jgi:hypothetical protein
MLWSVTWRRHCSEVLARSPGPRDWALAGRVVSYDKVKWAISCFSAYKSWARIASSQLSYKRNLRSLVQWWIHLKPVLLLDVPFSWKVIRVMFIHKLQQNRLCSGKILSSYQSHLFSFENTGEAGGQTYKGWALVEHPMYSHRYAYQTGRSVKTVLQSSL